VSLAAALDGSNGRAIMTLLTEIAREQKSAVLVVTHDSRVMPFADRIIYIEDGSLRDEETGSARVYPIRKSASGGF